MTIKELVKVMPYLAHPRYVHSCIPRLEYEGWSFYKIGTCSYLQNDRYQLVIEDGFVGLFDRKVAGRVEYSLIPKRIEEEVSFLSKEYYNQVNTRYCKMVMKILREEKVWKGDITQSLIDLRSNPGWIRRESNQGRVIYSYKDILFLEWVGESLFINAWRFGSLFIMSRKKFEKGIDYSHEHKET